LSKYARRVDANQQDIIKALMAIGCTVADTSRAGQGFPDLVVGYRGKNYLIECKNDNMPPSKQKLKETQVRFHESWSGQIAVVNTPEQAVAVVMS